MKLFGQLGSDVHSKSREQKGETQVKETDLCREGILNVDIYCSVER